MLRLLEHAESTAPVHVIAFVASVAEATPYLTAIAQLFCWHSVLTTNNLGHAIEEFIWGATYAALLACLTLLYTWLPARFALPMQCAMAATLVYVAFMFVVDVPMYVRRWRAHVAGSKRDLTLFEGLVDCTTRRVHTTSFETWGPEMPWLTGYFVGAVALSIQFMHVPAATIPATIA